MALGPRNVFIKEARGRRGRGGGGGTRVTTQRTADIYIVRGSTTLRSSPMVLSRRSTFKISPGATVVANEAGGRRGKGFQGYTLTAAVRYPPGGGQHQIYLQW